MPVIIVPGPPYVPPVTVTSVDGFLTATTDPVNGGVLLEADYSAAIPQPYQVRFYRNGVPVRSGDPAWAPGGYATAYDYEMPLGVVSTWTVVPIYRSATGVLSNGVRSAGAGLFVADVDSTHELWIKSVANPSLSMRIATHAEPPGMPQTGRNSLTDIPQSRVFSGSWDINVTAPRSFDLRTDTLDERDRFHALLTSGPLLIQCFRAYGIYDFYALAGDVSETYIGRASDPIRQFVVTFTPINRPPTASTPLYIPGHSYDDVNVAYATLDILLAAVPDYAALIS